MPKKNRALSTAPHRDHLAPAPTSWRRVVSAALLTAAGLAVTKSAVRYWELLGDLPELLAEGEVLACRHSGPERGRRPGLVERRRIERRPADQRIRPGRRWLCHFPPNVPRDRHRKVLLYSKAHPGLGVLLHPVRELSEEQGAGEPDTGAKIGALGMLLRQYR
ncbi:hypothetical protein SAMN05216532_8101 [Streptomyces sp. 2231.1]|uniref:hypothetical protein n=1 Tax=Streptomyces sp. 2231.1 TaxID=1855347 RepID=UPI00089815AD|nr:hypothetical protein [Streptomyces sp. 2231.1]SEE40159.1 hypothetical protein SAMN05216532_8101 [Streptomyces sp. 2231.1]